MTGWSQDDAKDDKNITRWDGNPASFLNWLDDVKWFTHRVKREDRQYVAAKLVGGLTAGARDVVIKWDPTQFECDNGVEKLIAKLKRTPLVRQSLPDAVQCFNRYFDCKRNLGTGMGRFLVLETKLYEEFKAAIHVLYEEENARQAAAVSLDDTFEGDEYGEEEAQSKEDFLLDLIRGWRLLDATGLYVKERQAIMASTGNNLGYEHVHSALRAQWSEDKDLQNRDRGRNRQAH